MRTLKICILACLLLLSATSIALAVYYPEQSTQTPYVIDEAHEMSYDDIQKLNNELKDYNIRTSNEILVVTVTDLYGMNAEEYARELFNRLGVGKAQKNNGVILLHSPKDRDVAIQVGLGLEDIMPDSVRGEILDNDVIPYFAGDEFSEGLQTGAKSIMKYLDQAQAARSTHGQGQNVQPPSNAGQEQTREPTIDSGTMKGILYFVILVIVVIGIVILVGRSREKAKTKHAVLHRLTDCENVKQPELGQRYNSAKVKLALLEKNNPSSTWQKLEIAFQKINFESIGEKITAARMKFTDKSPNYNEVNNMLDAVEKDIENHMATCEEIENLQSKINDAREESAKLLKQLPERMGKTENLVAHADVFPQTKNKFDEIKARFKVAQSNCEGKPNEIDWIKALEELSKFEGLFNEVQHQAQNDIAKVERARKEGPQLLANLPKIMDETAEELGSEGDYRQVIENARKQYQTASTAVGRNTASDLQVYFQLMTINNALERAKQDRIERIEVQKREIARLERERREEQERRERARRYSSSGGGHTGIGGGSHRSYGGGGGGGRTGGGGGTHRKY